MQVCRRRGLGPKPFLSPSLITQYKNVPPAVFCNLDRKHECHIDADSHFLEHLIDRVTDFGRNLFRKMELLLNLLWLLLVMPAFWLWRYSRTAPERRAASPLHCLLALGCLLVILFPVISATDDLNAMRAEMEESPASKRNVVGHSSGDKSSPSSSLLPPALIVTVKVSFTPESAWYQAPAALTSVAGSPAIVRAPRAPPTSLVA